MPRSRGRLAGRARGTRSVVRLMARNFHLDHRAATRVKSDRTTRALTGFAGGLEAKQLLLGLESGQSGVIAIDREAVRADLNRTGLGATLRLRATASLECDATAALCGPGPVLHGHVVMCAALFRAGRTISYLPLIRAAPPLVGRLRAGLYPQAPYRRSQSTGTWAAFIGVDVPRFPR